MAHQLTIRENGYTEMAFVGGTPWHGLGQELDQNATIEQWRVAAGMDWSIESSPVCFMPHGFYGDLHEVEKQNVLYIENNKYFDILVDPNNLSYHVVHCIKGKYCYESDLSPDKINKYKSSLFKCDNFEKPLKAMSYYKLNELVDICKYLSFVSDFHKKTKKELYELLLERL